MFLVREKVSELSARIELAHDDSPRAMNSLGVQGILRRQGYSIKLRRIRATRREVRNVRARGAAETAAGIYRRELKIRLLTTCETD